MDAPGLSPSCTLPLGGQGVHRGEDEKPGTGEAFPTKLMQQPSDAERSKDPKHGLGPSSSPAADQAIFQAALRALVALVFLCGRAEALTLTADVGGYNSMTTASCDGIPPPICFLCTATNSASCPGSVSTASASPMLELASYSSSTYDWQSHGASGYTETMSFDKPGLTGTDGTLLINFQITGETQLSGDNTSEDAAGGFDASTKSCDTCGTIDSTGDSPIQLHGPATVPFLIHFTYGNSFILSVALTAGTFGRYPETVAVADFSHTAKIGSFEFRDQGGDLVSDVEVTTQAGINPFVPEPEPAALAVASCGVLFFLARGR